MFWFRQTRLFFRPLSFADPDERIMYDILNRVAWNWDYERFQRSSMESQPSDNRHYYRSSCLACCCLLLSPKWCWRHRHLARVEPYCVGGRIYAQLCTRNVLGGWRRILSSYFVCLLRMKACSSPVFLASCSEIRRRKRVPKFLFCVTDAQKLVFDGMCSMECIRSQSCVIVKKYRLFPS